MNIIMIFIIRCCGDQAASCIINILFARILMEYFNSSIKIHWLQLHTKLKYLISRIKEIKEKYAMPENYSRYRDKIFLSS